MNFALPKEQRCSAHNFASFKTSFVNSKDINGILEDSPFKTRSSKPSTSILQNLGIPNRLIKESNLRIKKVAVVHGEEDQAFAFADHLKNEGFPVAVPDTGEMVALD